MQRKGQKVFAVWNFFNHCFWGKCLIQWRNILWK